MHFLFSVFGNKIIQRLVRKVQEGICDLFLEKNKPFIPLLSVSPALFRSLYTSVTQVAANHTAASAESYLQYKENGRE